ncbi:MAG: restriction endonuclease subunit S [Burkholderiaceae bacterium]|nr:restriction endonuclease subunit S [Burkholderiaceae bacterium]
MSDLPVTWEAIPLSAVIELNPKTTDLADDTMVGFVPMAMLGKSYLDPITFQRKRWEKVKRGYTHFRDGDVLLAKITPCFENGKAGLASGLPNGAGAGSTEYFVCRPRDGAVDARYLLAFLKTPDFVNEGAAQMTGSVGHKRVPKEYVSEQAFPLPPLAEQTRIADQLDTLLARVNACNDRLDAIPGILKRFRKAVLRHAATGQLSRNWREAQPEAVTDWQILRIKDVGRVQLGRQRAPRFHAGKHMRPYLRVQNVFEARLDLNDVMEMDFPLADFERYQLHPGDILLNEGQSPEYLGRPAMYRGELPGACFTNTLIRFQAGPSVLPEFALTVFRYHMHSGRYVQEGKITTNLAHLGAGRFADVEFPLPSLDEQREIVRRTDELLGLANRIDACYTAMRSHAQRLAPQVLAKAFRGELVQQDPKDEPASVLLQRLVASQPVKSLTSRGRPRAQPAAPERKPTDWAALPNGAWAAPVDPNGQAAAVWLTAVLRAWGEPMPEREARLATLLCQQPRTFTAVLPAVQAQQWSRLVGEEARPLPAQVARFQSATNSHWGRAIKGMKARGDLIEAGSSHEVTWALGLGAASIETAGWPDGRASFVVAHLRAHGIASVLPSMEPAAQEFVDVRAA